MERQHYLPLLTTRILTALLLIVIPGAGQAALAQQAPRPLDLTASGWQLVEVMSMDDSRFAPSARDTGQYTLSFLEDGSVSIDAGCNRGSATLQPLLPPRLKFGPVKLTRAQCPSPTISGRFLDQLPWIRSYSTREGRLYLATAADATILEFEPLSDKTVTANVLGTSLISKDPDALRGLILARLLDNYATANNLAASEEEVNRVLSGLRATTSDDDESAMTRSERADVATMRQQMAEGLVRAWKVNAALYTTYGGKIIYQQLGPEPLDAYRQLLQAAEKDGQFSLLYEPARAPFWNYFTDTARHQFMPAGSEDARRAFTTPPWEQVEQTP